MRLDEFIDKGLARWRTHQEPSRAALKEPGFLFLYVRLRRGPVLEFSTVTVERDDRGRGLFTKTIKHIKYKYPEVSIIIESVTEQRFQTYLTKLGFESLAERGEPKNFFLPAEKDLVLLR